MGHGISAGFYPARHQYAGARRYAACPNFEKNEATKAATIILHSASEPADIAAVLTATGAIGIIAKTGDAHRFARDFEALVSSARQHG